MKFLRNTNNKIFLISFSFTIIFIMVCIMLLKLIVNDRITLSCNIYYEQISNVLVEYLDNFKKVSAEVASDENIIKILDKNTDISELSEKERDLIKKKLNLYQSYIETVTFADSMKIVSMSGNYVFYSDMIYENINFDDILKLNKENLGNNKVTVTDIYKDPIANKNVISIMSYIYSRDNKQVLGIVFLDIFVDELLNYIDSSFYSGKLETYIKNNKNNNFYRDEFIENINISDKHYYRKLNLNDNNVIEFNFDTNSIKNRENTRKIINITTIVIIITGVVINIALITSIRLAFKPILKSIKKLKVLLNNLDESDFDFNNENEIKQLEFISDLIGKSFNNRIKSLIYYDDLTGLPNRKMMKIIVEKLIQSKKQFALIFVDLNKFKYVNDIYGHSVGDELLVKFSNTMKEAIGKNGTVTRYSGDEFVIIYENFIDESTFKEFYKKNVLKKFQKLVVINNNLRLLIDFSAGVAVYPKDGDNFNELIKRSDFIMYRNKKDKLNNNLLFFNNDMYNEILNIENIKSQLKNAIKNGEFSIYYQPIVNKEGVIKKAEALLRWNSTKLGYIPPDIFINYAEETRDIIYIGYWVIDKVCCDFQKFSNSGIPIEISINVSPVQLMDINFVNIVKRIIDKYNINYSNLYFEITESVMLEKNEIVSKNMYGLKKLGIKLSLDDFGTGYASFSYLKKYKLDILKLDKMFIKDGLSTDFEIIKNIKNIVHMLNMKIVVEGVETEEQFNCLSKIGCDFLQGYYFSKPITSIELEELLNKGK